MRKDGKNANDASDGEDPSPDSHSSHPIIPPRGDYQTLHSFHKAEVVYDIYATSIDYDPTQEISLLFFKTVRNKVHWAITGQTAAEIVHGRVDAAKPNLGLTNWRGAVIRKQEVAIAKNYLTEPELAALNNLVEQYLIFAQGQAMRRVPMHMADWIKKLDGFLRLNERDILTHAGRISHEMAQAKAEREYDRYRALADAQPRPVDAYFEQAAKQLQKLPRPKKSKPPKP